MHISFPFPFLSAPISSSTMSLLFAIFLFLISSVQPISSAESNSTVYEILQDYDFPVGLLPKGVTSCELDTSTGKFSVYLNETCTFKTDTYELKYKSKINGVIKKDQLSSLSGIQVKVLFVWLSIIEVIRDDDELAFSVGIASSNFPIGNFDECPTCGCGFDCDDVNFRNINRLISSS